MFIAIFTVEIIEVTKILYVTHRSSKKYDFEITKFERVLLRLVKLFFNHDL